jgi:hypothetical protein
MPGREPTDARPAGKFGVDGAYQLTPNRTLTRVRGKASILDWPEARADPDRGRARVRPRFVPIPGPLSMPTLGSSVWKTWSNQRVPHKTAGSGESTRAAGAQRLSEHVGAVIAPAHILVQACRTVSSRVSRIHSPEKGWVVAARAAKRAAPARAPLVRSPIRFWGDVRHVMMPRSCTRPV